MLKPADDNYKEHWQHCYDVGLLLETRGYDIDGVKIDYSDRGDWSYYIIVDHVVRVYDLECQSIRTSAETIKDVVVRVEKRIEAKRDEMSWNYRVVRKGSYLGIHEAYYEGYNEKPHSITENACRLGGDTIEELEKELEHMKEALNKPILEYGAFEKKE